MTPETSGLRCMLMRGGTSKGAFFVEDDLPSAADERDALLMRVMGTPDPRQIDGVGGAHPLTTKVAIVSPSNDRSSDVEYLFLQLGVDEPMVTDRQNCGNMLAAVGPFAVERGLVEADDGIASVRIFMKNTKGRAVASFPVKEGAPVYEGDAEISGVPGSAARIDIEFLDIAGGSAGALLPTGNVSDFVAGVEATLIDNGMPVVVMRAADLGVTGGETCEELESNQELIGRLEEIRMAAGPMMNLGDVSASTIPKMTMVSDPRGTGAVSTRTFIPHRCHRAIGVLGAVSVATACLLRGAPAAEIAALEDDATEVRLEHPSGVFDTRIRLRAGDGAPSVQSAGIVRTARKLMDGVVFPRAY
jgi:4-oxalomesaconate tautomerase